MRFLQNKSASKLVLQVSSYYKFTLQSSQRQDVCSERQPRSNHSPLSVLSEWFSVHNKNHLHMLKIISIKSVIICLLVSKQNVMV